MPQAGHIEIDATVKPSRVKGIIVMADSLEEAEKELEIILKEEGLPLLIPDQKRG